MINKIVPSCACAIVCACLITMLTLAAPAAWSAPTLTIAPSSLQVVASRRVGRTVFEYDVRASVANNGTAALNVKATVTSHAASTTVIDANLAFGAVAAGAVVASTDTFTIRQDRLAGFDAGALVWSISFDVPQSSGTFDFQLQTSTAAAYAGSPATIGYQISRDPNFTAPVSISLTNPPDSIQGRDVQSGPGTDSGALFLSVAGGTQPGVIPLTLTATDGTRSVTRAFTLTIRASAPPAQKLIADALASGQINAATALLYRAYAIFGDSRLPPAFAGSGSVREDRKLIADIETALPTLDPAIGDLLRPFTLRPAATGSWYALAQGTATTAAPVAAKRALALTAAASTLILPATCEATDGTQLAWISRSSDAFPFRVWAQCLPGVPGVPAGFAESLVNKVVPLFDKIWPGMTARMGTAAKPDRDPGETLTAADGKGDDKIDIYISYQSLTHVNRTQDRVAPSEAWGVTYGSGGGLQTSAYILLPLETVNTTSGTLHTTAIHELMHVFQFAQNAQLVSSDWWYTEASARWAETHFDRVAQPWGPWSSGRAAYNEVYSLFLSDFQQRDATVSLNHPGDGQFGGFIWPYFMEQESGAVLPAGGVWAASFAQHAFDGNGGDAALDSVFSFASNFREFAIRNINKKLEPGDPLPTSERYVSLDSAQFQRADNHPPKQLENVVSLAKDDHLAPPVNVAPLAAQYAAFVISPFARKVTFDLTGVAGATSIDAFVQVMSKDWERRDYSSEGKVIFCRDDPTEAVEQLILVIANSQRTGTGVTGSLKVDSFSEACQQQWKGRTVWENQYPSFPFAHTVMSANLTWDINNVGAFPGIVSFNPSGSISVDTYSVNGCVWTATPRTSPVGPMASLLVVNTLQLPGIVNGDGGAGFTAVLTGCPGTPAPVVNFAMPFWPQGDFELGADGNHIDFSAQLVPGDTVIGTLDLHYTRTYKHE